MPKATQTSSEGAGKAVGDNPLVLWTRSTSAANLSDPFLDNEDIGCEVLGSYEDDSFVPNTSHLSEPTLPEGVFLFRDPQTPMTLILLSEIPVRPMKNQS